jgi:hypothetical protein
VVASTDTIDPQWDGWNLERNNLILTRLEVKGASTEILPQSLRNESYSLEENGVWEEVYSESSKSKERLWRPTKVDPGWRPFTSGRWVEIYGENCWVPDEPFGYVTHHFGNWEFINGNWYWAPPAIQPQPVVAAADEPAPSAPPAVIEPAWYPGRVGWFYSDTQIGWVPLAPQELFVSVNYWGPQVVMAGDVGAGDDALPDYAYYDDGGVVVEQHDFYHVENYTRARITNIHNIDPSARTYKRMQMASAPKSVASDKSRFSAGQISAGQSKPSQSVTSRIQQTKANVSENSASLKSTMSGMQTAKPAQSAALAMKRPEPVSRSANRVQPGSINSPLKPATSNTADRIQKTLSTLSPKPQDFEKAKPGSATRASGKANNKSAVSRRENGSSASGSSRQMRSDTPGRHGERNQVRSDTPRQPRTQKMSRTEMQTKQGAQQQGRPGAAKSGSNMRNAGGANSQRTAMPRAGAPRAAASSGKKK